MAKLNESMFVVKVSELLKDGPQKNPVHCLIPALLLSCLNMKNIQIPLTNFWKLNSPLINGWTITLFVYGPTSPWRKTLITAWSQRLKFGGYLVKNYLKTKTICAQLEEKRNTFFLWETSKFYTSIVVTIDKLLLTYCEKWLVCIFFR